MEAGITVVKLGGHAMEDPELLGAFAADLAALEVGGRKFVIIHGGGPHINRLLGSLAIESAFVDGLRVTTPAIMEVVEMALCGKVNKEIVRAVQSRGRKACGISGMDGPTLLARLKSPQLGLVGEVIGVNVELLTILLNGNFVPVVAPVALDESGQPLNVNADTAAGAIAAALHAELFVLVSDVPGVLDGEKRLLARLDDEQIESLCEWGVISGGMLPKVECCRSALKGGCKKALVLDGRHRNSFRRVIEGGESLGTEIVGR